MRTFRAATGKLSFLLLVSALLLTAASCNRKQEAIGGYSYAQGRAELAGRTVQLEVARDEAKKEQGLSGQDPIPDDRGMLFVYGSAMRPYFWMKEMKFDIDIVWIRDGVVVDITRNAKAMPGVPEKDLPLYQPKADVDAVLELAGGWSERYGLKVGDKVTVQ